MISICIPVYNYDVNPLVQKLKQLIDESGKEAEIICIDDCSPIPVPLNTEEDSIRYITLPENSGRSKTRNEFLKYARFNYLLFLDCDTIPAREDFLIKYLGAVKSESDVVCGGIEYSKQAPSLNKRLRWKYGLKKEVHSVKIREQHPYRSFMSGNFMIKRSLFESVGFDERITSYGHEDTLFGFSLKEKGTEIQHIQAPVIHMGLDTNEMFISKTESGLINLAKITDLLNTDLSFTDEIRILKVSYSIGKTLRGKIISGMTGSLKRMLLLLISLGLVSLFIFDLYKLSFLLRYIQKK